MNSLSEGILSGFSPNNMTSQVGWGTHPASWPWFPSLCRLTKPSASFVPPTSGFHLHFICCSEANNFLISNVWGISVVYVLLWSADNKRMIYPCSCQCVFFFPGNVYLPSSYSFFSFFLHCLVLLFMVGLANRCVLPPLMKSEKQFICFVL